MCLALAGSAWGADPTPGKNLFHLEVIAYSADNCPQGIRNGNSIAVQADVTDNPNGQLKSAYYLARQNDILLTPGDFDVIDGNACIDGTATFQLPLNPIGGTLDDPTFQNYEVYARLVGKPGTAVDVRTCAVDEIDPTDPTDDTVVCSTENYAETRTSGKNSKPTYTNVSKALLTICLDTDGDSICDVRYALFDPALYDYFWNWNTTGKAHAQLVFVAVPD
jgi:hypothetical protein